MFFFFFDVGLPCDTARVETLTNAARFSPRAEVVHAVGDPDDGRVRGRLVGAHRVLASARRLGRKTLAPRMNTRRTPDPQGKPKRGGMFFFFVGYIRGGPRSNFGTACTGYSSSAWRVSLGITSLSHHSSSFWFWSALSSPPRQKKNSVVLEVPKVLIISSFIAPSVVRGPGQIFDLLTLLTGAINTRPRHLRSRLPSVRQAAC